jgi:hypothetical protein
MAANTRDSNAVPMENLLSDVILTSETVSKLGWSGFGELHDSQRPVLWQVSLAAGLVGISFGAMPRI